MYDCLVPAPLCISHCHVRTCKLGMHVKLDGSVMNGVPSMVDIITSIKKMWDEITYPFTPYITGHVIFYTCIY